MWNDIRDELGIRHEEKEDAARFLLHYWAEETAGQRIDVLAGSRLIYRAGWFPLGQPSQLNELLYLLVVWAEMPDRREETAATRACR